MDAYFIDVVRLDACKSAFNPIDLYTTQTFGNLTKTKLNKLSPNISVPEQRFSGMSEIFQTWFSDPTIRSVTFHCWNKVVFMTEYEMASVTGWLCTQP